MIDSGMWPMGLSGLVESPWLEEAFVILFTVLACISAHYALKSVGLRGKSQKTCNMVEESECTVADQEQQEYGALGEAKRAFPKSSVEIEGVTDKRFAGVMVCYKPQDGYGFIQCSELSKRFDRDVFLHRLQVGNLAVGTPVTFSVFLNKQGWPQAKEVEALPSWQPEHLSEQASTGPESDEPEQPTVTTRARALVAAVHNLFAEEKHKAWESVMEQAKNLNGTWAGDRDATYRVHWYQKPREDRVGTVWRSRAGDTDKPFGLRWDAVGGKLQLSGHFHLDLGGLTKNADTATWCNGQSRFIWRRVQPSGSVRGAAGRKWNSEDDKEDTEAWEQSEQWRPKARWSQQSWSGVEAAAGKWQPKGQPARRWVPKEEAK